MRALGTAVVVLASVASAKLNHWPLERDVERISINDNRRSAGALAAGVLTLRLEVREGEWRPDGDSAPAVVVRAFAEEGKALQVPGPLVRVPLGTTIRATVRNRLGDSTLVIHGLAVADADGKTPVGDTISVRPGEVREVEFVASTPGTYSYWATAEQAKSVGRSGRDSQLGGAIIVDDAGASPSPNERVLVLSLWERSGVSTGFTNPDSVVRFTINGRAWPHTERLSYAVGDSVRFRLVNLSLAAHPMHLHGFYFNVDSRGNGRIDRRFDPNGAHHLVVTERMPPGSTMSLTWVPVRAGNWLFHCHDNYHVMRGRPFDGTPIPPEHLAHVTNHSLEMMGGLVMGVTVRSRGESAPNDTRARRELRLLVREDSGHSVDAPAYGYQLEDGATLLPPKGPLLPGPTIVLRRDEPVAIRVVNQLAEATAVHWHGIELESYYDGVAGFSGKEGHIAPAIAPRDSFVALFTPPRAGTFIYHPHADEVRQQAAGLSGAIVVLEPGVPYDPTHDTVLLISTPRIAREGPTSVYLNGTNKPKAMEWRAGEKYRLRIVNIHTYRPSMFVALQRDSTTLTWRAIAKDGMDLDPREATSRLARVQTGNGETFDYEFIPQAVGDLSLTVRAGAGALLVNLPIHVR